MKKRKRNFAPAVAILLIAVLFLPACADNSQVVWDEIFVQELNPDAETMQALRDSVQNVDIQSTGDDGVTIHVRQTLGDAKSMYIALQVTFPDDLDSAASIAPPLVSEFVSGKVDEKDLTALSSEALIGKYARKGAMAGSGSRTCSATQESAQDNSFLYLISLNSDEPFIFEKGTATLLIGGFTIVRGDGTGKTYPSVHAISWTPTNQATVVERTITTKDEKIAGRVLLSPFSFTGSLYFSGYKEMKDFYRSIYFIQNDGTEYKPSHSGGGGAFSDNGSVSQSYLFKQPLDLDNIKEIHIGGYTVNVQDAAE